VERIEVVEVESKSPRPHLRDLLPSRLPSARVNGLCISLRAQNSCPRGEVVRIAQVVRVKKT
jgi:hypothetical protein